MAMLDDWRKELQTLRPGKRGQWHTRIFDPWGVAQKVRYVGDVRYFSAEGEQVPYEFEVYRQSGRVDGGVWCPIADYTKITTKLVEVDLTGKATFSEFSIAETGWSSDDRRCGVFTSMETTMEALPEELWERYIAKYDELERDGVDAWGACAIALYDIAETHPAELLAASEAVGGWPPKLRGVKHYLEKRIWDEASKQREQRRDIKEKNRRARAAREAAASSSEANAPATAAAPMPVATAAVALWGGLTEADKEVQRANEDARQRKLLTKKAVVQPSLARTAAVADDAAGQPAPAEKNSSKNARRRQERKLKQQQTQQRRIDEKQQHADDQFRRVLKAVEPLRQKCGTVVREDLEHLDSVKELDTQLKKEEKQAKAKPRRAPTPAEAEATHALLETVQLRGKMRQEVEAFVRGFPGIAPGAEGFAERLVHALLGGGADDWHDARETAELYGDFADAYAAHDWIESRLERTRRNFVLRAAALA